MTESILALPRTLDLGGGYTLDLLSAWEAMECRREGEELAAEGGDAALCANACLIRRALRRGGKAVFDSGRAVLEGLTAGQIACLARRWGEFDRECDPAPWEERAVAEAKKAWSTRLMSAFSGACSKPFKRCPPRNGRSG